MDGSLTDCAHVPLPDAGGPFASVSDSVEGSIGSVTPTSFEVDTCPPNANCVDLYTFKVQAPGLVLALPVGAFVHVDYGFSRDYSCTQSLEVDALPTWNGLPDPQPLGNRMLLSVVDGAFGGATTGNGVYRVRAVALGCDRDAGTGCGPIKPDEYALDVSPAAKPSTSVRVYMGKTAEVDLSSTQGAGVWRATNLRSYQTDACDDYANFAWFITWQAP